MNKLALVMAYFCVHYPFKEEISNARLTKMIYLADLYSVQEKRNQITDIRWFFDNFGPFVHDIENEAYTNPNFEVISGLTMYGTPKKQIKFLSKNLTHPIPKDISKILDKVIDDTKSLNWNEFIEYVYNTSPIKKSYRYSHLDLSK